MTTDHQTEELRQSALTALAGKYLTFKLDVEEFGLEILTVQEIIKMMEITRVPRTPPLCAVSLTCAERSFPSSTYA